MVLRSQIIRARHLVEVDAALMAAAVLKILFVSRRALARREIRSPGRKWASISSQGGQRRLRLLYPKRNKQYVVLVFASR